MDSAEVIRRNPDVIIASWCGMKANAQEISSRPGWQQIAAVRDGHIYEILSSYILQPGPASLTEGVRQLHWILSRAVGHEVAEEIVPSEKCDPDVSA